MRPGFGWLWVAAGSANLGDGVTMVAIPVVAVGIGATPAQVAVVVASSTLAWPLLGLVAGWVADRVDRRRVLLLANLARAAVLATGVIAAWHGALSVPILVAIALGYGIAETLVDTAVMGLVPAYASTVARAGANARLEGTVNLANQLVGPPVAGVLIAVGTAATFGTGAVLYLGAAVAAAAMLRRAVGARPPAPWGASPFSGSILSGLRFIWRSRTLRALTLLTAAMNLVWGCFTALFVVHALAPEGLDLSPTGYGFVLVGMAVGGIAASAAAEPLRRRVGARHLLMADSVGTVLLVAPVALGLGAPLTIAGAVVAGAGSSIWRILVATIRHAATPGHLFGRVYAASRVVSWGALPVGSLLCGVLASVTDVRTAFAAASLVALVVGAWFLAVAGRLDLETAFTPHQPPIPARGR